MNATKTIPFDAEQRISEKLGAIERHIEDNHAEISRLESENDDLDVERDELLAALEKVRLGVTDTVVLVVPSIDQDPVLATLDAEAKLAAGDWDRLRDIKARYDARVDALFADREESAIAGALKEIAA